MSASLWLSALLMGLLGGPHCLAMCGAACSALAGRCGGSRPQQALLAWQAGRLVAYSAAGAVVASSVGLLAEWGRELAWLRPWWLMLHLAALTLGLWMMWHGRAPAWLSAGLKLPQTATSAGQSPVILHRTLASASASVSASVSASASASASAPGPTGVPNGTAGRWWQAGGAGLAWVALPCGLLQAALLTAALGSTAADGAMVMASFALGSGLSLWLGPSLWLTLANGLPGGQRSWLGGRLDLQRFGPVQATRLAGAMLALGSGWAIGRTILVPAFEAFCA